MRNENQNKRCTAEKAEENVKFIEKRETEEQNE